MDKDTALDLALEALEHMLEDAKQERLTVEYWNECVDAITAIKQARALDKKAENARELGLDYEPVGEAYLCDKCQTPFDGAWECPNCGHRSATKEPVYTTPPAAPVQVSPLEFVTMVMEKEHLVGKPLFWAEWPNKEKNT